MLVCIRGCENFLKKEAHIMPERDDTEEQEIKRYLKVKRRARERAGATSVERGVPRGRAHEVLSQIGESNGFRIPGPLKVR